MGFDDVMARSSGRGGAELQPGTLVGSYRIERLLGRGGMGEVYLAEHIDLHARYALKVLPPNLMARPTFLRQFRQEAQTLARLDHPNIVRVTHFGESRGIVYLAMEYLPGDDVERLRVQKGGKLPLAEVRGIIEQVLKGLSYAHQQGVVHRDLKPANLLIGRDGCVRVSDFGLAALVRNELKAGPAGAGDSDATVGPASPAGDDATIGPGAADPDATIGPDDDGGGQRYGGTLDYMSPEAREGKPVGPAGDIFSLGVMTHFLLTGSKPGAYSKPASRMVKGVGREWDRFIERCIAPDPTQRFRDAGEALQNLPGTKKRSPLPWVAGAGVAALLLAAVAVGVALLKDKGGSPPEGVSEVTPAAPAEASLAPVPVAPGVQQPRQEAPGPVQGAAQASGNSGSQSQTPSAPPAAAGSRNVSLAINSQPPGAQVSINGRQVGRTPLVWRDGKRGESVRLELTAQGHVPEMRTMRLTDDGSVELSLKGLPGNITLTGLPPDAADGATLRFAGVEYRLAGGMMRSVASGEGLLEIEHPAYQPFARNVYLPPGGEITVDAALQGRPAIVVLKIKPRITSTVTINGQAHTSQGGSLEVEAPGGQPLHIVVQAPRHKPVNIDATLRPGQRQEFEAVLLRE